MDTGGHARIGAGKAAPAGPRSSTLVLADITPGLSILIGLGLICVGFGLRVLLDSLLMNRASFIFFMPGVVAAAAFGGLVPALIVTAAGALAALAADVVAGDMVSGSLMGAFAYALLGGLIALGGRWYCRAREVEARFARDLAGREAMLSSVLRTIPDALIIIDERGVIHDFSDTAERQFGWTADEVTGRNINMLMPSAHREAHSDLLAGFVSTHEPRMTGIGGVLAGERKDGSTFPMELSVGEMHLPAGRFYTSFVRDLTERQKTESRLQELQSELVHMSRLTALGEMASALAHELNQPLSAIGNYLMGSKALLKREQVPHARVADAVERAGLEALRAGEIIRRLRDFVSRGETERRVESLPKLVEEASALALVGAKEAGVRARFEIDPEIGSCPGRQDPDSAGHSQPASQRGGRDGG